MHIRLKHSYAHTQDQVSATSYCISLRANSSFQFSCPDRRVKGPRERPGPVGLRSSCGRPTCRPPAAPRPAGGSSAPHTVPTPGRPRPAHPSGAGLRPGPGRTAHPGVRGQGPALAPLTDLVQGPGPLPHRRRLRHVPVHLREKDSEQRGSGRSRRHRRRTQPGPARPLTLGARRRSPRSAERRHVTRPAHAPRRRQGAPGGGARGGCA